MKKDTVPEVKDRYFSRAVSNALRILDIMGKAQSPMSLSDIARKAGVNKTSAFRFLYTMEETGHVSRDETGRYSVPVSSREPSTSVSREELGGKALPHMKKLRSRYSETISLGILLENHIEVIQVQESPQLIKMCNRLGAILPPHASSMGKAITAFQEEDVQEKLVNSYGMPRLTDKTITDGIRLREEYAAIRKRGWSQDDQESAAEGQCYGVPVWYAGKVIAAVSISFPVFRVLKGAKLQAMLKQLQTAAAIISADLESSSHQP